jgi:hypothetical protein
VLIGVALGLVAVATEAGDAIWVAAVVLILAGFVVEPVVVLAHELGHAAAGVAATGRRARVQVGDPPFLLRFAVGKIDVAYTPLGQAARCESAGPALNPRELMITALAGPVVSVGLGLTLGWIVLGHHGPPSVLFGVLAFAAGSSLIAGVVNAIPIRRLPFWWIATIGDEAGPSDGYLALLAIRSALRGESRVTLPFRR